MWRSLDSAARLALVLCVACAAMVAAWFAIQWLGGGR